MSIVQQIDDGIVLTPQGEVDYSNSHDLRHSIMDSLNAEPQRVVIDLSNVPYLDSSGLAIMVEALQVQRKKNHKLVLCGLQPKVKGIIEIARLDPVFIIVENVETAKTV